MNDVPYHLPVSKDRQGKPQEIAQIEVNGAIYKDWKSVRVHLAVRAEANYFEFTTSEGQPSDGVTKASNWSEYRIRPGDRCAVYLAGELAIAGFVTVRQVAMTGRAHGIEIIGMSANGAMQYGAAMSDNGEMRHVTYEQAAQALTAPFGINFIPKGDMPGNLIDRVSIPPGQSARDALENLSRQAGVLLSTAENGDQEASPDPQGFGRGSDTIIEGINMLEGREILRIRATGPMNFTSQHTGNDDQWGGDVAQIFASKVSPLVKAFGSQGFYAPLTGLLERAGRQGDNENRAGLENAARADEDAKVTATVHGWLRTNTGGLWWLGDKVHVISPALIMDETLTLMEVTFTQDDRSGSRSELELARFPGSGYNFQPGGGGGEQ